MSFCILKSIAPKVVFFMKFPMSRLLGRASSSQTETGGRGGACCNGKGGGRQVEDKRKC